MAELTAALEDALAGHGRLVMLAGEPGIGKTRIAQELAAVAEQRGANVLWGRCYEGEGAPPYWPWVQSMRSYVQLKDAGQLAAELGPCAAHIAEVVPEIRSKLPDLETPTVVEPDQARFRLFDSVTSFLRNASRTQSLMLVLDDLHWADRSSLLLLEFIAGDLDKSSTLLIGTYRDMEVSRQHPLSQTLGSLVRERRFQRLQLAGLNREEVARFVEVTSGGSPLPGFVEAVHARTEGNPLFVGEVVRQLEGEVFNDPTAWSARIPAGIRDVIGKRLDRLSEYCNQTLTTASVIGREFTLQQLHRLLGDPSAGSALRLSEDRLLDVVEEASAARVIEELPQSVGHYQFTHALIQETLAGELSATRRVRLHARIAEALEALYSHDAEDHAAELAHHFVEAEPVLGPEKLVRYSLLAGERALASYAYEDALTHFERGLVARDITLSGTEAASDEEAAALLFGMGRTLATFERRLEAFATLRCAFDYYAEAGNIAKVVSVAEFPISLPADRIPGVAQLIARALTLVPADSHEAGRLLSRYGGILGAAEGDYEGAQQALGRAIAIARRERDVVLEVRTLTYAAAVSGRHLRWQDSVDNGLRAIELATGDENPYSEVVSRYWTAQGLLYMGDLNAARHHVLVLRDLAERRSTPRQLAIDNFTAIMSLACLEGDWNVGREYADRALDLSPLPPRLLLPQVLLEHETGNTAEGQVYLERLLEAMRRAGPNQLQASSRASIGITAVARITGVPDRLEIAEAAAESVTPQIAMYAKAGLALLAVQKGDQPAAEEQYAYFLGLRGTMIATVISVDRILSLLSQTMGDLDQATAHFEDALEFSSSGCRPELAWTCCDYADTLLQKGGTGEHARAMSLLEKSLSVAGELGMGPLMERVVSLQEKADSQPARGPEYPDGLTPREVEVLRLIATGKTDREVSEELFVSVRTVTTHVSNIRNKIGAANRTEAATYANRHGLA